MLCGKCPRWHGPYWYAFWFASGRTRSAYVGSDERLGEFLRLRGEQYRQAELEARGGNDDGDELARVLRDSRGAAAEGRGLPAVRLRPRRRGVGSRT